MCGVEHEDRLDQIVEAVGSLRHELTELRASLAREVRTRRVVVIEEDGSDRVVLEARGRYGRVGVLGFGTGRATALPVNGTRPTCVELVANDATDGEGPHLAVALTDSGDVVATLEVHEGRRPVLWIGPDI
jgi:hypothetical protein